MAGYPPPGLEPAPPDDPLREAVAGLRLEQRPVGPPHQRSTLLISADETPWAPGGGTMIVLSARLLRTLLLHARFWRPRERTGGRTRRVDIRV